MFTIERGGACLYARAIHLSLKRKNACDAPDKVLGARACSPTGHGGLWVNARGWHTADVCGRAAATSPPLLPVPRRGCEIRPRRQARRRRRSDQQEMLYWPGADRPPPPSPPSRDTEPSCGTVAVQTAREGTRGTSQRRSGNRFK